MALINGDLVPSSSGLMHLGIDGGPNVGAFDFGSLAPFGHVHQNSGVFHHSHATGWESGVLRFNAATPAFEVSVDGGITFQDLQAGAAGGVTAIGVLGGADLTGSVDLTPTSSGFIVIGDTGGASPITFSVDTIALSGLWGFPANGFDNIPTCYNETFGSANLWTVTHNLNTTNVIVQVYNNASPPAQIMPDQIVVPNANTVNVRFNVAQAGDVVVIACENS